jgi:hypothetical protein
MSRPRRLLPVLAVLIGLLVVGAVVALMLPGRDTPVAPAPTPTATPSAPAQSPDQRLAAAVKAVFPQGATAAGDGGEPYTFATHRLIDAPFGPVLVSEGRAEDAAHVTAGRLDIAYLRPDGAGFAVVKNYPAAVQAGSYGQMSEWSVSDKFADVPTIDAEGGFTGQGYTCAVAVLTELRPDGPVEVGTVQTVFDNSGAVLDGADTIEGKFANIEKNQGFDVRYSGSKSFVEHYALRGGKYVRQGETQLPEC